MKNFCQNKIILYWDLRYVIVYHGNEENSKNDLRDFIII